jgi:hypothetical protein
MLLSLLNCCLASLPFKCSLLNCCNCCNSLLSRVNSVNSLLLHCTFGTSPLVATLTGKPPFKIP